MACFGFSGPFLLYRLKKKSPIVHRSLRKRIIGIYIIGILALICHAVFCYAEVDINWTILIKHKWQATDNIKWSIYLMIGTVFAEFLPLTGFLVFLFISERKRVI